MRDIYWAFGRDVSENDLAADFKSSKKGLGQPTGDCPLHTAFENDFLRFVSGVSLLTLCCMGFSALRLGKRLERKQ
jgi:hypothetical protein